MFKILRSNPKVSVLLLVLVGLFVVTDAQFAEARVGGGRSSGRSSFGSRRMSPSSPSRGYDRRSDSRSSDPYGNRQGGFLRGLAGGVAGGFLGSMLFSSLGHAGGFGGGGGGLGFLEILLIAGLAYLGFRWWKNRAGTSSSFQNTPTYDYSAPTVSEGLNHAPFGSRSTAAAKLDSDEASDIFFKIQAAWTRRDLSSVRDRIGGEMTAILDQDLQALKNAHRVNRLENISVRRTDVTDSWQEDGVDYATVRFTANLLDYTVDETSNQIVEGSDTAPVKFEEDWTFAKGAAKDWQLVGIQQA